MKTYEEIVDDLIEYHFKNVSPGRVDIKKQAAKEYAKQWVGEVIGRAHYDEDKCTYVIDAHDAMKIETEIDQQ